MSFLRKLSSEFVNGTKRISVAATVTGMNMMSSSSSNIGTDAGGLPQDHPVWKLGRLNHLAIAVPDLEKSAKFWRDVMGAESVSETKVDDVVAAVKDLVSKNVRSLDPEPKIGAHGKPVVFLHPRDCGGVLVELEQA
ncbi:11689_t:CDS:2 [Ambispora gerdemannii]|uniref:11689_t:CDS:1 n=1 Tax=Ambispora gerdemannii TaxID=144530 RepID=A0A9N8VQS9_9GLOM|nr:11689_t:CDS:2 [Ambispora gerdemannii]